MKTKMCNVVVRDGFVYGLDDVLLECIELETGAVQWKKRRHPEFGHGQIMLIGNTILVLSETGELALVEADPHEYRELASMQALDEPTSPGTTRRSLRRICSCAMPAKPRAIELPLKKVVGTSIHSRRILSVSPPVSFPAASLRE